MRLTAEQIREQRKLTTGVASEVIRHAARIEPDAVLSARIAALAGHVHLEIMDGIAGASMRPTRKPKRATVGAAAWQIADACVHESSHACYALSVGLPFTYAAVCRDGSGSVDCIDHSQHSFATRIMLYIVGSVGAFQLQPKKSLRGYSRLQGRIDREILQKLIRELPAPWRIAGFDVENYFDEKAAAFVRANRRQILAVADELFQHRTLTEKKIRQIIAGVL